MMSFKSIFISVFLGAALITVVLILNAKRPAMEVEQPSADFVRATGKCAECHRRETSAVVHQYERSEHAKHGVSCLDCHKAVENQETQAHRSFTIFDHAQNGFFNPSEWLPVFTSAIAVGCLATLFLVPPQPAFLRLCVIVLGINFIVGIAGFFLHLTVDLQAPGVTQIDKFLYGAPLFAPLLFPNLSLLALLGIWKMSVRT